MALPTTAIAILVNGPSSAGKSTLCAALLDCLADESNGDHDKAFARVAFDDFLLHTSEKFYPRSFLEVAGKDCSSLVSKKSHDGKAAWEYVDNNDMEGKHGGPRVRLQFNTHGRRLLSGLHRCWGEHLKLGTNLVIDHFLQDADWCEEVMTVLKASGGQILLVGVHCDLDELERREKERGDRPIGLSRRSDELVHSHGLVYDVTLNTSVDSREKCLATVLDAVAKLQTGTTKEAEEEKTVDKD